jgi:hypothetical protein
MIYIIAIAWLVLAMLFILFNYAAAKRGEGNREQAVFIQKIQSDMMIGEASGRAMKQDGAVLQPQDGQQAGELATVPPCWSDEGDELLLGHAVAGPKLAGAPAPKHIMPERILPECVVLDGAGYESTGGRRHVA